LNLGHGERLLLVEQVLERRAGDVFHHEVVQSAFALDAVDRNDVRVVELGGRFRLLLEAAHDLLVLRHVGGQHLDRHVALERQVVRQEHGPHAALSQ